jgi:hypothetical protein
VSQQTGHVPKAEGGFRPMLAFAVSGCKFKTTLFFWRRSFFLEFALAARFPLFTLGGGILYLSFICSAP